MLILALDMRGLVRLFEERMAMKLPEEGAAWSLALEGSAAGDKDHFPGGSSGPAVELNLRHAGDQIAA